jgi:hypothetical protein
MAEVGNLKASEFGQDESAVIEGRGEGLDRAEMSLDC